MPDLDWKLLEEKLSDQRWRLANLYTFSPKEGVLETFKPNWAQLKLLNDLHHRNVILKARQIGFTTLIQILMLDVALFHPNTKCGVIAQTMDIAQAIFEEKIKLAYDHLPNFVKKMVGIKRCTTTELHLSNGSSIRVNTSMRGTTLQYLHVSEYGKICAVSPEKSREIRTGALQTVPKSGFVFIESTAEGSEGHFFELCERARKDQRTDDELTALDWKFHFFPWHEHPEYRVSAPKLVIPRDMLNYFNRTETKLGIAIDADQRAFYMSLAEDTKTDMAREYPSYPEEAFEAAIEGAYYATQFSRIDKQSRIRNVPFEPALDVETAWDLGMDDETAIWFVQRFGREVRVIDYYASSDEGLEHFANVLRERSRDLGYRYSRHILPHDVAVREMIAAKSRKDALEQMGVKPIVVAPKLDVADGIEQARQLLARCYFDASNTTAGIKHLREYRKAWDAKREVYRDRPLHDLNSHAADAFRYLATAPEPISRDYKAPKPKNYALA